MSTDLGLSIALLVAVIFAILATLRANEQTERATCCWLQKERAETALASAEEAKTKLAAHVEHQAQQLALLRRQREDWERVDENKNETLTILRKDVHYWCQRTRALEANTPQPAAPESPRIIERLQEEIAQNQAVITAMRAELRGKGGVVLYSAQNKEDTVPILYPCYLN